MPYEELEQDALEFVPFLNALDKTGAEPFTAADVVKALEAYDASYLTFPRHTIEELRELKSLRANAMAERLASILQWSMRPERCAETFSAKTSIGTVAAHPRKT